MKRDWLIVASLIVLPLSPVLANDVQQPAAAPQAQTVSTPSSATASSTPVKTDAEQTPALNLADGTKIKLQLVNDMSSNKSKTGDEVRYVVDEDVVVDKMVVIKKGTPAVGVVSKAKGAGGLGRAGKLEMTADYILLPGNVRLPLRGSKESNGKSGKGSMAAVALLVSPLGLFMKGHNITVKAGTVIDTYVNTNTVNNSTVNAAPSPARMANGAAMAKK